MAITDNVPTDAFEADQINMENMTNMVGPDLEFENRPASNGAEKTTTFTGMTSKAVNLQVDTTAAYNVTVSLAGFDQSPFEQAIELPEPDFYLPLGNQIKKTMSGDVTFTRASLAWAINQSGEFQEFAVDEIALSADGVGVFNSYKNIFLLPTAPASQTVTISARDWTLWVIGSGSVECVYGVAYEGRPVHFYGEATTLDLTVVGSVDFCNLIDEPIQLPPILDDAEYQRVQDKLSFPIMNNFPPSGSLFSIFIKAALPIQSKEAHLFDTRSTTDFNVRRRDDDGVIWQSWFNGDVTSVIALDIDDKPHRFGFHYDGVYLYISIDGVPHTGVANGNGVTFKYNNNMAIGDTFSNSNLNSYASELEVYHRELTPAQIYKIGSAK